MLTLRGKALFWWVAGAVVIADLVTKWWVFHTLGVDATRAMPQPYEAIKIVPGVFHFEALLNPGMMWGVFREHPELLRVFRLAAVAVVIYLFLDLRPGQRLLLGALGAVLGGALGNIYDSFRFGAVRDFLHFDLGFAPFDPWPAFNLADASICVGVAVLALSLFVRPAPAGEHSGEGIAGEGPSDLAGNGG